jgi:glutaminyl-tRNA synthetase
VEIVKTDTLEFFFEGDMLKLHKPGGNKQIKQSLMEEHLKATGGRVMTRFPPEPNGFLHIGHAKAININFGYAQVNKGSCNLRYDDTNPEAEEGEYFDSILNAVEWLGFQPAKITYSSDHFQTLYDLAVELVKKDKAYVCFCTGEEIQAGRGGPENGPRSDCRHRNRPIAESLKDFERMKNGCFKEGEAILRMKMDMQSPNPQFWDLVAYRILYTAHHRTGKDWCIYPTYDYTHCLCDSFENITHSLCTREFTNSRESYYWLCDALEVYKPVQWEYGRLNLTNTVLSKRKLTKLVQEGHVEGWDDPRLYTLPALKRRGVPPQAINAFVRSLGVTTSNTTIEMDRFDNVIRDYLNETTPRLMLVENPIKVTLTNVPESFHSSLVVPNRPRDTVMGEHTVPFTRVVYIDRDDYRDPEKGGDDPNFYRLSIGKRVGLLYVPGAIKCTAVTKRDPATGEPLELEAEYEDLDGLVNKDAPADKKAFKKPKAYLHWVAESAQDHSPLQVTLYKYGKLFEHSNPMDKNLVPNGWLSDVRKDSLQVLKGAMCEVGVLGWLDGSHSRVVAEMCQKEKINPAYPASTVKFTKDRQEDLRFQLVRLGYYCLDKRSQVELDDQGKVKHEGLELVFNRTVSLKEDGKKD